jgi:hypothetical protein
VYPWGAHAGSPHSIALQMLAYYIMAKTDLFQFTSGAMVATRDDHKFEGKPGPELAAGRLESKALESALKSSSASAARLSAQSMNPLSRQSLHQASNNLDLARQSLAQLSAGGLGHPSLYTIDERQAALNRISNMAEELRSSVDEPAMRPHIARISAAAERLRRVSNAMDQQRGLGRPSHPPVGGSTSRRTSADVPKGALSRVDGSLVDAFAGRSLHDAAGRAQPS